MNEEQQPAEAEAEDPTSPAEADPPGRLGDRLPEYRELSDRVRELNKWSRREWG